MRILSRQEPDRCTDRDSEMIGLAASWMSYGDVPAEEIWLRFGIDRATFGRRLLLALDSDRFPSLVAYAERLVRLDRRHPQETAVRRER